MLVPSIVLKPRCWRAKSLGMIEIFEELKNLINAQMRAFLDKSYVDSETVVTNPDLSAMFEKHIRMNMKIKFSSGNMKLLLMDF